MSKSQLGVARPRDVLDRSHTGRDEGDLVLAAPKREQQGFGEPRRANGGDIIVIEFRPLLRECIAGALRDFETCRVAAFPTVESWIDAAKEFDPCVILLGGTGGEMPFEKRFSSISQHHCAVPKILISDGDEPSAVMQALALGARGFIPTSLPLTVAVHAVRLVIAGGVFVPASTLVAARRPAGHAVAKEQGEQALFTNRQAAIVDALSRGKANKAIAYELNMCESTVKVHVRNIMKKLNAKNRTEVALMASGLLGDKHKFSGPRAAQS